MSGASISYPHRYAIHPHHGVERRPTHAPVVAQSSPDVRSVCIDATPKMATCYPPYDPTPQRQTVQVPPPPHQQPPPPPQPAKDYTRPLHVDCSVEYELPNTAKPPQGVRNEPLLMIHPCYFRKIESQRRSPFVNNLPTRPTQTAAVATAAKRRLARVQQQPQPTPAAPYPTQYATNTDRQQLWGEGPPMPPLVPISQPYGKRDQMVCGQYHSSGSDSGHWTDPERSPDRPDDHQQHAKHSILSGKYRQYLRAHRLHPYVTSAIPLASTFPQIQQVCYNV